MSTTVDRLIRLLDVQPDGDSTFSGCPSGSALPRVFGGHVLGQALAAAARTVDRCRRPHSLHAYFLRAGASDRPIHYEVAAVREGRSFSTREVRARQGTKLIFTMTASFRLDEPGPEYQRRVPLAPPPHTLTRNSERPEDWPDLYREWTSLDIRAVPTGTAGAARAWLRATEPLPGDPLLHACILACISDLTLLSVILTPHGIPPRHEGYQLASLDHSVWFHRPCRVDEWLLYDQDTPSTWNALGLAHGRILTADGVLAASVAQEGLIRRVG